MSKDNETDAEQIAPQVDPVEPAATATFEWNDQTWTVPSDADEWPFDATEALEQGKALTFVRLVLGSAQMRQFARGGRTKTRDGAELMDLIVKAVGGKNPGE